MLVIASSCKTKILSLKITVGFQHYACEQEKNFFKENNNYDMILGFSFLKTGIPA